MKTIRQVLEAKGNEILSISPDRSVYDAVETMAKKGVGSLIVLEEGRVVGLVSERDYARKIILKGLSSPKTPVRDIMATQVVYARPELTIEEGLALMTDKCCRHLPVMDNDQLLGVLSIGDLVKASLAEKTFLIDQLGSYITGTYPEASS